MAGAGARVIPSPPPPGCRSGSFPRRRPTISVYRDALGAEAFFIGIAIPVAPADPDLGGVSDFLPTVLAILLPFSARVFELLQFKYLISYRLKPAVHLHSPESWNPLPIHSYITDEPDEPRVFQRFRPRDAIGPVRFVPPPQRRQEPRRQLTHVFVTCCIPVRTPPLAPSPRAFREIHLSPPSENCPASQSPIIGKSLSGNGLRSTWTRS